MLYTTYTGYAMLSIHALPFFSVLSWDPTSYGQQHFSNKDDDDDYDKNRDQIQSRTIRKL